jgi:translation elongation factor EF-G
MHCLLVSENGMRVAKAAGAVILEPIMKMEVITPEENIWRYRR